jgi:hypothetical protein
MLRSADQLPEKSGTQEPSVVFAIAVVGSSISWRANVLASQCLRTLQTEFLHSIPDGLEIVSRSGSGHGSSCSIVERICPPNCSQAIRRMLGCYSREQLANSGDPVDP